MLQPAAELGLGGAGEVADAEAELHQTLPAERYAGPSGDADSATNGPQDRHHVLYPARGVHGNPWRGRAWGGEKGRGAPTWL